VRWGVGREGRKKRKGEKKRYVSSFAGVSGVIFIVLS